jgi:hypothetical protein
MTTEEQRQDLLAHYRANWTDLDDALAGLSPAQMNEASIDGWSVKDNLAHLAVWDDLRADEVIRISAGFATTLPMTPEQDAQYNALAYELRRDLSLDQVLWEIQHSRQRLTEALTFAPLAALDPARYGEAGLLSGHASLHAGYIRDWRSQKGV